MSTPNEDEADRDNGTYSYREEEKAEGEQNYTTEGIGYTEPPQYEDHEDHQQSGNANPPAGESGSAPNQTDAPEDVPSYEDPEPEATYDAGGGTTFVKGKE